MRKVSQIRTPRIKKTRKREGEKRRREVRLHQVAVAVVVGAPQTAAHGHQVAQVHPTAQAQDPHHVPVHLLAVQAVRALAQVQGLEPSAEPPVVAVVAAEVQSRRKSKRRKRRERNQRNQNPKHDPGLLPLVGNVRNVRPRHAPQRFMWGALPAMLHGITFWKYFQPMAQ